MKNLAVVCAIFFLLPFLLGFIHRGSKQGIERSVTYYRYFAFFNVILAAIFVASRLFFQGKEAAAISGWTYSPVFHLYGFALLSIALMGLFTVFRRGRIMIASAMCWSYFLVLSSLSHLYQVYAHQIKDVSIILVHVIYNFLVTIVLVFFILKISRYFQAQQEGIIFSDCVRGS